jgi:hypothetical protein
VNRSEPYFRADAPIFARESTVVLPRLSWRVIPLERRVHRRFEVARIGVPHPHVMTLRRVWQLLSQATAAEGQSGRIDDPGLLEALETAGRVRVRWHLVQQPLESCTDAEFPEDGSLHRPMPDEPLEGWAGAPLMYPWGDASERQIVVSPDRVLRLYVEVEQRDGTLTAVGGLLEGSSEGVEALSDRTEAWLRSGKDAVDRANECFLAMARSLDTITHYVGSEMRRGVADARQMISSGRRKHADEHGGSEPSRAAVGMLPAAGDPETGPHEPVPREPSSRVTVEGIPK